MLLHISGHSYDRPSICAWFGMGKVKESSICLWALLSNFFKSAHFPDDKQTINTSWAGTEREPSASYWSLFGGKP